MVKTIYTSEINIDIQKSNLYEYLLINLLLQTPCYNVVIHTYNSVIDFE